MSPSDKPITHKTISSARAYAFISIFSQIISWGFTFWVIRLLNPEDYGLMAMASVMTGFMHIFSQLGFGAGVIQKKSVSINDLSSLFWFSIFVGLVMSGVVFFVADFNAAIFGIPDLVPVTQLISILFVISAVATVPRGHMSRHYMFKDIAKVNLVAAMISSIASVIFAYMGFGVYTLILSSIILELTSSLGFLYKANWLPSMHFNHRELKPYLKFGLTLSVADAFTKLLTTLDKLIVGKLFAATQLGFYSTARNLSTMPINKISPLINSIIFPILSRWQNDHGKSTDLYLKVLVYYLLIISPIYIGGILLGDDLILFVLGEKWEPVSFMFRIFCWVSMFEVLASYHKVLVTSRGMVKSIFWYNLLMMFFLIVSITYAANVSIQRIMYVWAIVYPLFTFMWIVKTSKDVKLTYSGYFLSIFKGIAASIVMVVTLLLTKYILIPEFFQNEGLAVKLGIQIMVAILAYVAVLYFFQKKLVSDALITLRAK